VVALNKVDVPEARELADLVRPDLEARGLEVFTISAASHEGLRLLTLRLAELVEKHRLEHVASEPTRIVLRPAPVGGQEFTVTEVGDQAYRIDGVKPLRWVRQTDFTNEEAIGFLADRLAKIGVESELAKLGAQRGAEVSIGDVTFDWEPTVADAAVGPRGTDARVVQTTRKSRAQRETEYFSRHRGAGADAELDVDLEADIDADRVNDTDADRVNDTDADRVADIDTAADDSEELADDPRATP